MLDGDPASPPLFGLCLLWSNGCPSQLLLSTCLFRYRTAIVASSCHLVSPLPVCLTEHSIVYNTFAATRSSATAETCVLASRPQKRVIFVPKSSRPRTCRCAGRKTPMGNNPAITQIQPKTVVEVAYSVDAVKLFTALHLSTYRTSFSTSPICRRDVEAGCARRHPVSLTSVRRDLLLSAIVRLLLPARDSGTVYLSPSSLPRHSQHLVRN